MLVTNNSLVLALSWRRNLSISYTKRINGVINHERFCKKMLKKSCRVSLRSLQALTMRTSSSSLIFYKKIPVFPCSRYSVKIFLWKSGFSNHYIPSWEVMTEINFKITIGIHLFLPCWKLFVLQKLWANISILCDGFFPSVSFVLGTRKLVLNLHPGQLNKSIPFNLVKCQAWVTASQLFGFYLF